MEFAPMNFFLPVVASLAINLGLMDTELAANLSGNYVKESISESPSAERCPNSLEIEITAAEDSFLFKSLNDQKNLSATVAPRTVLVDGETRQLHTEQLARAEVLEDNRVQIQIYDSENPKGKVIVENYKFTQEGTLEYSSWVQNVDDDSTGDRRPAEAQSLCEGSEYNLLKK